jgi:hypothetical protein
MSRQLTISAGADKGCFFKLADGSVMTIGSSRSGADIRLNDPQVHRVHCQVEVRGDQVVAWAIDPDHPLVVKNRKVSHIDLHLGDVFRIGNTHLRLEPAVGVPEVEEVNVEILDEGVGQAAGAENRGPSSVVRRPSPLTTDNGPRTSTAVPPAPATLAPALPTAAAPTAAPAVAHVPAVAEPSGQVMGHYEVGRIPIGGSSGLVTSSPPVPVAIEWSSVELGPDLPLAVFTSLERWHPERIGALALYCSDGRWGEAFDEFCHKHLQIPRYDRWAVPGGPAWLVPHLAVQTDEKSHSDGPGQHETTRKQLDFLVKVHELEQMVLITHYGCAYYGHRLQRSARECLAAQTEDVRTGANLLRSWYPGMRVEAYLAMRTANCLSFHRLDA